MDNRRGFLKSAGAGIAATGLAFQRAQAAPLSEKEKLARIASNTWPIRYLFQSRTGFGNSPRIQQLQGIIPDGMTGGLPVFPVQLMESLVNLMIFAFLLILEPRLVRRGQLFALYLVFYAISRFGLEFLRGDYNGEFLFPTPAQILCLLLLPAGVLAYFYCHCRGQVKQSSDMMDKADVQRK